MLQTIPAAAFIRIEYCRDTFPPVGGTVLKSSVSDHIIMLAQDLVLSEPKDQVSDKVLIGRIVQKHCHSYHRCEANKIIRDLYEKSDDDEQEYIPASKSWIRLNHCDAHKKTTTRWFGLHLDDLFELVPSFSDLKKCSIKLTWAGAKKFELIRAGECDQNILILKLKPNPDELDHEY